MLDYVEIRDLKKPRMHSVYIATMASRAWPPQVSVLEYPCHQSSYIWNMCRVSGVSTQ